MGSNAVKAWNRRDELQETMSREGQRALQHQISAHPENQNVLEEMGKKVRVCESDARSEATKRCEYCASAMSGEERSERCGVSSSSFATIFARRLYCFFLFTAPRYVPDKVDEGARGPQVANRHRLEALEDPNEARGDAEGGAAVAREHRSPGGGPRAPQTEGRDQEEGEAEGEDDNSLNCSQNHDCTSD